MIHFDSKLPHKPVKWISQKKSNHNGRPSTRHAIPILIEMEN